jgi:capsule polysaccharide export protein KpsE/RkpR
MNNPSKEQNSLLSLLLKYWKVLTLVFLISLVSSVIFSSPWFITPLYKSTSVLYPSNLIPYSTETETEQMLQFFESNAIRDSIIQIFNLSEHYNIDKDDQFFKYRIYEEFDDHINISRTEYESVQIDVLDKDPMMAYEINRAIIDVYNKKVQETQRNKSREVLLIKEDLMNATKLRIDSIFNRLQILSEQYNLVELEVQIKEAYRGFFSSSSTNHPFISQLIKNFEEKGEEFKLLSIELENTVEAYAETVLEYEEAKIDVTKELTYSNEIISPYPPDKKAYPVRWLIVVVVVFSSFFVALFGIAAFEQIKKFKLNA